MPTTRQRIDADREAASARAARGQELVAAVEALKTSVELLQQRNAELAERVTALEDPQGVRPKKAAAKPAEKN